MELQLTKPVSVYKTLVLPVDARITKKKKKFLDKLTARLTYGVQLFLEKILATHITRAIEAEKFRKDVEHRTGLSSGFAQACRDKALWMVRSYQARYRAWQGEITRLEKSITTCKDRLAKKYTTKDQKRLRKLQHKIYRWEKRNPPHPRFGERFRSCLTTV